MAFSNRTKRKRSRIQESEPDYGTAQRKVSRIQLRPSGTKIDYCESDDEPDSDWEQQYEYSPKRNCNSKSAHRATSESHYYESDVRTSTDPDAEEVFEEPPRRKFKKKPAVYNLKQVSKTKKLQGGTYKNPIFIDAPMLPEYLGADSVLAPAERPSTYGTSHLERLPLEIKQRIISFLPNDSCIQKFMLSSKTLKQAVTPFILRELYIRKFDFDLKDTHSLEELADRYKARKIFAYLRHVDFEYRGSASRPVKALTSKQEDSLNIIKDLIIESNASKDRDVEGNEIITRLNHDYLIVITASGRCNILNSILSTANNWEHDFRVSGWHKDALILVIQLSLSHLVLNSEISPVIRHFDFSFTQAYKNSKKQPVFLGKWKQEVNVRWCLSVVNLFKHHMKGLEQEALLAAEYSELEACERPQAWFGKLQDRTQMVGGHWKGAFTYMDQDQLIEMRRDGNKSEHFVDDVGPMENLSIFLDDAVLSNENWPMTFEHFLESNPYARNAADSPSKASASLRRTLNSRPIPTEYPFKTFFGSADGHQPAHFYGRMHAVPPQQGIPGFQRVVMIKYEYETDESVGGGIWGYEGCVLPGGRMVVGRWWSLTQDPTLAPVYEYSGPFIFWNVELSDSAELPHEPEPAADFLRKMFEEGILSSAPAF